MNRLKELQQYGQSVWLDYIRRSLITSGELGGPLFLSGRAGGPRPIRRGRPMGFLAEQAGGRASTDTSGS
jgi:hypothetical protein